MAQTDEDGAYDGGRVRTQDAAVRQDGACAVGRETGRKRIEGYVERARGVGARTDLVSGPGGWLSFG